MVKDTPSITITEVGYGPYRLAYLDLTSVQTWHISNANISKMVTDVAAVAIAAQRCSINIFRFDIFDAADLFQLVGSTRRVGRTPDVLITQRKMNATVLIDLRLVRDDSLITSDLPFGAFTEPRAKQMTVAVEGTGR